MGLDSAMCPEFREVRTSYLNLASPLCSCTSLNGGDPELRLRPTAYLDTYVRQAVGMQLQPRVILHVIPDVIYTGWPEAVDQ